MLKVIYIIHLEPDRADQGDDRYFPLGAGNYLICISADTK